jgi:hypothetical protein
MRLWKKQCRNSLTNRKKIWKNGWLIWKKNGKILPKVF